MGTWSYGTEFSPVISFAFFPANGAGGQVGNTSRFSAVAVRQGSAPTAVPEPQTLALVLLALGATMVVRRRRPV